MRLNPETLRGDVYIPLEHGAFSPPRTITTQDPFFVSLPLCGLAYQAVPDGLVGEAWRTLNLRRLGGTSRQRIWQLQNLTIAQVDHAPVTVPAPHAFRAPGHDRWFHSLGAGGLVELIAHNNGLTAGDRNLLILAMLTHDKETTAGGDATKYLCQHANGQENLAVDEDAQYGTTFHRERKAWYALERSFPLPVDYQKILTDAVTHGQGWVARVMDIADVLSYLSLDLHFLETRLREWWGENWTKHCPAPYLEIFRVCEMDPGRIWNSVEIRGENVVVHDAERLNAFLRLRILMWKMVYINFATKFLETLFVEICGPFLLRRGALTIQRLARWEDARLHALLKRVFRMNLLDDLNALGSTPRCESFTDQAKALAYESALSKRGAFTLLKYTGYWPKIKTKTDKYWLQGADGVATPFAQAFPRETEILTRLAKTDPVWVVYYVEPNLFGPRWTPNLKLAWEEARKRWHAY